MGFKRTSFPGNLKASKGRFRQIQVVFGATLEHEEVSPGKNLGLAKKSKAQVEIWEWELGNSGMRLEDSMGYQQGGGSGVTVNTTMSSLLSSELQMMMLPLSASQMQLCCNVEGPGSAWNSQWDSGWLEPGCWSHFSFWILGDIWLPFSTQASGCLCRGSGRGWSMQISSRLRETLWVLGWIGSSSNL